MSLKSLYRQARAEGASDHEIARAVGMPVRELTSRVSGAHARGRTREASEFQVAAATRPPRRSPSPFAWSLEAVRVARDNQLIGLFEQPVRLAEASRADDALFVAYRRRKRFRRCVRQWF
jgi:hypothetical protein